MSEKLHYVESEQDIFYLDKVAKAFVRKTLSPKKRPSAQMEELVYAVFDRSKMNLLYQGGANTSANETFHTRAANCLSMSIMMYALAKEAGFDVNFQEIIIPEYWTRRNGYSLLNGHINLRIKPKVGQSLSSFTSAGYQVDFDPQVPRNSLPKKIVSKQDVVAMFYNNKGADALMKSNFIDAYSYFRAAILKKKNFESAWINLGILYRHMGYFPQAEQAYQYAIQLNAEALTAWENLAYLYSVTDREVQAQEIFSKVNRKRRNNPYYHLNLGEEQIERKNWDEALAHFKRALSLDRHKHETYYGLARVYLEIGELQQSERYLKQARNTASSKHWEETYQNKLSLLSEL
ncbi:tetratricopeptide repeat protein [Paraglaciecola aquimarina]|uniref:Tetratricopeptide repeat protein n=1 Tax=Paraglaciecola algarum TaxID=3050085 RepID=A0ABS9D974_9ALTE|nr:tetratricopeptide repeat protein [Paraglaciecola sp. G1-23]